MELQTCFFISDPNIQCLIKEYCSTHEEKPKFKSLNLKKKTIIYKNRTIFLEPDDLDNLTRLRNVAAGKVRYIQILD